MEYLVAKGFRQNGEDDLYGLKWSVLYRRFLQIWGKSGRTTSTKTLYKKFQRDMWELTRIRLNMKHLFLWVENKEFGQWDNLDKYKLHQHEMN